MQQVFNFQQLGNSLAGLFDGSNATRGRADRARAEYEEQRARQIAIENDYKDPSKVLDWSAMFSSGGDPNKLAALKQYIHPDIDLNQAALKQVSDAVSNTTKPAETQDVMRSIYQLTDADKKSFGQAYQNYFANSAFGGNGRMMIQNMLDMDMQNRQFSEADNLASAYKLGNAKKIDSVQATIAALAGKNYDPYAATGGGLMYNKSTGQVDTSNPYAVAKIGEIGARTNLIGAQTQGEYLNHGKTQAETQNIQQGMVNTGDKLEESIFTAYDPANNQKFIDQSKVGKASIIRSMTGVTMNQAGQILSAYPNPEAVKAAVANGYVSREIANAIFEANRW